MEQRTENVNKKKNLGVIHIHFVINDIGKNSSSKTMWNIMNQVGKHSFCCS